MSEQAFAQLIGAIAAGGAICAIAYGLFEFLAVSASVSWRPHRLGAKFGAKDEAHEVVEWSGGEGWVRASGELWRARSSQRFAPGDRVKISKVDGLTLLVKRGGAR